MSPEEQKVSAGRIMAKLGPLDAEEQESYRRLTMAIEEYPPVDLKRMQDAVKYLRGF